MVAKLQVPRQVFPLGCVHCHKCLKVKTVTSFEMASPAQISQYNVFLTVVTANAPPHYCALILSVMCDSEL